MASNDILRSKRKFELSYLNIFCTILVIFIHCASILINGTLKGEAGYDSVFVPWRFSSFVVPAFIFMSGIKMFLSSKKINYIKFYLKRITRVILPYMLWVVIFYYYFIDREYFEFSWRSLCHYWYRGDLVGHFYFVIIIVQFYILMPIWKFILPRLNAHIAIVFSLLASIVFGYNLPYLWEIVFSGQTFPYGDIIFTKYLAYWVMGCYVGLNYEKFKDMILSHKLFVTILFLLSGFMDIYFAYQTVGKLAPWMEIVHVMYCVSAIIFFFMLFSWICRRVRKMSWFTRAVDMESYNIFLSHCLVIFYVDYNLGIEKGIENIFTRFWNSTVCAYVVTILFWVLWWLIKLGTKKIIRAIQDRRIAE